MSEDAPALDLEPGALALRPDELVYRTCYAPVDLARMLESAETRSKIRRLPVPQLYYGIRELEDEKQVAALLPHVTEEQWKGVLDLDLWRRERMDAGQFIHRQHVIVDAGDAVARKIIRAAEEELWELAFHRLLRIRPREGEAQALEDILPDGREGFATPDDQFFIVLPKNEEAARITRAVLQRLYQLEKEKAAFLLNLACMRTPTEMEEMAYQSRKSRLEDLGFQDYYEAIEIYTPLGPASRLPEKDWERVEDLSALPARLPAVDEGPYLLMKALAEVEKREDVFPLMEELLFVCNKVLAADRVSPSDAAGVKGRIRKAVATISLGLDEWAQGGRRRAAQGIRKHFLQSFFQIGYGLLMELRSESREVAERGATPEPGSPYEAALEGYLKRFPLRTLLIKGKIRRRFFRRRAELVKARGILQKIAQRA